MKRNLLAGALVFWFVLPAQADLDIGTDTSIGRIVHTDAVKGMRLAQTDAPVITAPRRIDTDQDTVNFTGKVEAAGEVTLTVNGIPVPLAADGSFRIRQQVPVGQTKLLLVVEDASGQTTEQGVWVRRTAAMAELGDFGSYHALVIGNNDYQHLPDLKMAVSDAEAVAALLEDKYGFDVQLLRNATRYDIVASLERLRAELTANDNLLIYYAGHGSLDVGGDEGFWQPVDADPDISVNWVRNTTITSTLRAMQAKHVMVVADSCYSGKLTREAGAELRTGAERATWLKRMAGKRSRTAMVSGGLEPVLDAGGGDHSVFAKAFLDALGSNNEVLDGQSLFDAIKRPVTLNAYQTPDYADIQRAGHAGGDFLFVPIKVEVTVTIEAPAPTSSGEAVTAQQEMLFWQSIQNSTEPSMFDEYLRQFPGGMFAGLAKIKRAALLEAEQQEIQTAVVVPPTEPGIKVDEMDATFVALKTSNVRSEPTTQSDRVGRLSRDDGVAVTGKVRDGNWYRIEYEGETAYVFGTLIKEIDPGELAAWEIVANSSEAADFETFLDKYSGEHFAEKARKKRDELATSSPSITANPVDLAFWQSVKDSDDPKDLNAYLSQFPNGAFAALARNRLESLEEEQVAIVAPPPTPTPSTEVVQPAVGVYPKTYNPGDTFKDCDACPEMVVIPAGSFMMGDLDGGGEDNEKPVHGVTIPQPIAVGVYEVTRGEFARFVSETDHDAGAECWIYDGSDWATGIGQSWRDPKFRQTDRDPVVCINWKDAQAYVSWLSRATGNSYRLLSEAEWEYAARAGTRTRYWYGDDNDASQLCSYGNGAGRETGFSWKNDACGDGHAHTAPVGTFRANKFGLHDMHGNVWEWAEDCWHENYAGAPMDGRAWTSGGVCGRRVLRGGSWGLDPWDLRAANRDGYDDEDRDADVGFRVARTLP